MYKIMLADDEGIVIDALKFIIEKNFRDSCVIESAKTGRSVIELAESFRPDIAFMDIQMPGINGIEAMKEIRKIHASTIFIVVSAYDKFDYAKEAINLGVLEYLNKPIEQNKIVDILRRAMSMIDREREKRSNELLIREKLETVVPIIESGLIYSILFGEHFEEDIEGFKGLLGISEDYGYMIVLVFGEAQEGNHMTNAVGAGIRVQSAYQEVRTLTTEYFHGIIGPVMANKIPIFVPSKEHKPDYNERIEMIEKARELARKLKARINVQFRVGFGSLRKLTEAMESYNEALASLMNTTGSVAHVKDLPLACEYDEDYPLDLEKKLFDAIAKGESIHTSEYAKQYFDWMLERYGEKEYTRNVRLKVLEFVLWAEHIVYVSGGMAYHFDSRSEYLKTATAAPYEELEGWFVEKMTASAINIQGKKEESKNSVVDRAREFMKQQYQNDISLDEVSREVDISPYYFSKLFKEETGINFIEYLTNIRIDKAKELLRGSEYNMKDICAMVGYADPNYFSRIFKKNVGVTPTEYKEKIV